MNFENNLTSIEYQISFNECRFVVSVKSLPTSGCLVLIDLVDTEPSARMIRVASEIFPGRHSIKYAFAEKLVRAKYNELKIIYAIMKHCREEARKAAD